MACLTWEFGLCPFSKDYDFAFDYDLWTLGQKKNACGSPEHPAPAESLQDLGFMHDIVCWGSS